MSGAGETLPDGPRSPADFERVVHEAGAFFAIAECLDLGLDEGQRLLLSGVVQRLDQLSSELLDG